MEYEITIHNSAGMVTFSEVVRALNGTNALLIAINKFNLIIEAGDKININNL